MRGFEKTGGLSIALVEQDLPFAIGRADDAYRVERGEGGAPMQPQENFDGTWKGDGYTGAFR